MITRTQMKQLALASIAIVSLTSEAQAQVSTWNGLPNVSYWDGFETNNTMTMTFNVKCSATTTKTSGVWNVTCAGTYGTTAFGALPATHGQVSYQGTVPNISGATSLTLAEIKPFRTQVAQRLQPSLEAIIAEQAAIAKKAGAKGIRFSDGRLSFSSAKLAVARTSSAGGSVTVEPTLIDLLNLDRTRPL